MTAGACARLRVPTMSDPTRPRSTDVTEGIERAPARSMLRAVGFTDEDFTKPQVGVASSANEVTPCNVHLGRLAQEAKAGVREAGGVPVEFTTIAVSDGISMGTEGMRASLVSREVIADSVELVMHAERFDGMVTIAGCDKSLPGMLMASARLNLPAVFLYGGTILPGHWQGKDVDDPGHVRGGRRRGARHDDRGRGARHRARRLPRAGLVRWHVHGEHDGVCGRGAGHVAAGFAPRRRRCPPGATCWRGCPAGPSSSASAAASGRATS